MMLMVLFGEDDVGDNAAGVEGVDARDAHGGKEVVDAAVGLRSDGKGKIVLAPKGGDRARSFVATDAEDVLAIVMPLTIEAVEAREFALAVAAGGGEEDDGGAATVADGAVVGGAVGEGDNEMGYGIADVDNIVVVGGLVEARAANDKGSEEAKYVAECVNHLELAEVFGR